MEITKVCVYASNIFLSEIDIDFKCLKPLEIDIIKNLFALPFTVIGFSNVKITFINCLGEEI